MLISRRLFLKASTAMLTMTSSTVAALAKVVPQPAIAVVEDNCINVSMTDLRFKLIKKGNFQSKSYFTQLHLFLRAIHRDILYKGKTMRLIVQEIPGATATSGNTLRNVIYGAPTIALYMAEEVLVVDNGGNPVELIKCRNGNGDISAPHYSRNREYLNLNNYIPMISSIG